MNWIKCTDRLPDNPTENQLDDGSWPRYLVYAKLGWPTDYPRDMLVMNWDGERFREEEIDLEPITEARPMTEDNPYGVSHWAELPAPPEHD